MIKPKRIWWVYAGGFFLAIHYASVAYINSSLLSKFVSDGAISILYIIGSILSLASLALVSFFLRKIGNIATLLVFIILEIVAVFGMGSSSLATLILALFLLHQAAESILYFSLDVSLEHETSREGTTGSKRGIFLTVQNIAWVLSPLAITWLAAGEAFRNVYFLSGAALIPLFLIGMFTFRKTPNRESGISMIWPAIKSLKKNFDEARIIIVQFVLQFYFSWMVIYLPLLLHQEIGFGWDKIGILFTIMLLPYLLFEVPAGFLADKKFGEKEVLIVGFLIMAFATFVIPFLKFQTFALWATVLFATRIGASMIEIASETYFFRRVGSKDTSLISLFRMARPLSFVIVPLFAIPVLKFTTYGGSFLVLSILTLSGLLFIPKIDTK